MSDLKENSKITLYDGSQITVIKKLGEGGEGSVYKVSTKNGEYVLKTLLDKYLTEESVKKMEYIIANNPNNKSICFPTSIVKDSNGKIIGITMNFADGEPLEELCVPMLPKHLREISNWRKFSFKYPGAIHKRIKLCSNIAIAFNHLHANKKYVLLDIKPINILITSKFDVSVIDLNNLYILDPSVPKTKLVYTEEFCPPEASSGSTNDYTVYWDYYSLAIVFYRVLTGIHPFTGTIKPGTKYGEICTLPDFMKNGLLPVDPESSKYFSVIPKPHQEFYNLPKDIQELFIRALVYGYKDKHARPTTAEWIRAFIHFPIPSKVNKFYNFNLSVEKIPSVYDHNLKLDPSVKAKLEELKVEFTKKSEILLDKYSDLHKKESMMDFLNFRDDFYNSIDYYDKQVIAILGQNDSEIFEDKINEIKAKIAKLDAEIANPKFDLKQMYTTTELLAGGKNRYIQNKMEDILLKIDAINTALDDYSHDPDFSKYTIEEFAAGRSLKSMIRIISIQYNRILNPVDNDYVTFNELISTFGQNDFINDKIKEAKEAHLYDLKQKKNLYLKQIKNIKADFESINFEATTLQIKKLVVDSIKVLEEYVEKLLKFYGQKYSNIPLPSKEELMDIIKLKNDIYNIYLKVNDIKTLNT